MNYEDRGHEALTMPAISIENSNECPEIKVSKSRRTELPEKIRDSPTDPRAFQMRYEKLRRWMSSNVIEGWQEVERLGAIAVYEGWDAFDLYLDELPECNVGLSKTGENQ